MEPLKAAIRGPLRLILLSLLVIGVGACAAQNAATVDGQQTVLIVENDLIPSTTLSIYAVPPTGARTLVGYAEAGTTTTLVFDPGVAAGSYRYVAETATGDVVAATEVGFSPGSTIEWDVREDVATLADN